MRWIPSFRKEAKFDTIEARLCSSVFREYSVSTIPSLYSLSGIHSRLFIGASFHPPPNDVIRRPASSHHPLKGAKTAFLEAVQISEVQSTGFPRFAPPLYVRWSTVRRPTNRSALCPLDHSMQLAHVSGGGNQEQKNRRKFIQYLGFLAKENRSGKLRRTRRLHKILVSVVPWFCETIASHGGPASRGSQRAHSGSEVRITLKDSLHAVGKKRSSRERQGGICDSEWGMSPCDELISC